ncbi:MAG: hypothetical protein Q8904_15910, partial [Bacteroidota bacterium]|nr:hypothetical protein [Bacteroidota bacterium]
LYFGASTEEPNRLLAVSSAKPIKPNLRVRRSFTRRRIKNIFMIMPGWGTCKLNGSIMLQMR